MDFQISTFALLVHFVANSSAEFRFMKDQKKNAPFKVNRTARLNLNVP